MKYQILMLLVALISLGLLSQTVSAYQSCNDFKVNTTSLNSQQISGICYWQGGNLYLVWDHGDGSGFEYSVQSYNNTNATVNINGGGINFTGLSTCTTDTGSKYYPQGDYLLKIQTQGKSVTGNCRAASLLLESSLPTSSTSTTTRRTTVVTTVSTTSISKKSSTTINITISPSTPLLALSSSHIYTNGSVTITSRAVSSSDAIDIIVNGGSVSSGLGSVTYNLSALSAGNYSIQAYDVNQRLYSQELVLYVLPTITTSVQTTRPTIVTTAETYTTIQAQTTTQGSSSQQPNILQQIWNAITSFFSHL